MVAQKVDAQVLSEISTDGTADVWLRFGDDADMTAARNATDKAAKGQAVYEAKTSYADKTQEEARELLSAKGIAYDSYWIVNTIKVKGDAALIQDLAVLGSVERIEADTAITLAQPAPGTQEATVDGVEWNISNINAPQVWDQYGDHGEGIVVANVDTGVDYLHPAVNSKYRGKNADGTYNNNYNWYDASGSCPNAATPCDNVGHGTHTMGTMVGGDGANVIGVAPGAKWMATKACSSQTCTEQGLISSGQWILAPKDLNGQNPDPSKAPDIVNNSWGGSPPSDDPWYEAIVQSWIDAGIFPSWSNGNDGDQGCNTSGSPGMYPISYSSGAYDVNNAIAYFSGRGPGRNGQVKPNLAAPGVNVRSSLPGGSYGMYSGTSMAAPHTSAVVALMWSAAPSLRGDIEATKTLLNTTARDTENLECGGTLQNNNVFGEGRLDALAAVAASPRGGTGSLSGTVSSGGAPLAGATVVVDGPQDRTLTTGADGKWAVPTASAGDYTVTASKFGYGTKSGTGTVTEGQSTTIDLTLLAVPSGEIHGYVTDGGGQGWPLYAKVTVAGTNLFTYSNPSTGAYTLTLPSSQHTLHFESVISGYSALDVPVDASKTSSANAALTPAPGCTAPGYELDYSHLTLNEPFSGTSAPAGWTVVNKSTKNGLPWSFTNPGGRANNTGGSGNFAIADSDKSGSGKDMDTDLISPVVNLATTPVKVLNFNSDLYMLSGDLASVQVTVDGGTTWTDLWSSAAKSRRGPRVESIDLSSVGTATAAQLKFHYVGSYDWWWAIDNVQVGAPECVAVAGGLVVGNVIDQNTGLALNGAKVTDTVSGATATTAATPDDTRLGDGFYWMYTRSTGSHPFTAAKGAYTPDTHAVDVANHGVVRADFVLSAGRVTIDKTDLNSMVTMGGSWTHSVKLTNTGTAPATVDLTEADGGWTMQANEGTPVVTPLAEPAERGMVKGLGKDGADNKATGTPAPQSASVPNIDGWSAIADAPVGMFDHFAASHDGKVYVFGGVVSGAASKKGYVYDSASNAWSTAADLPVALMQAQAQFIGGKLYVTGGWNSSGDNSSGTYVYDPAANAWSTLAANPNGVAAAGSAVVDGRLYVVGGCEDGDTCPSLGIVQSFDPESNSWSNGASYPVDVAYPQCGGVDGQVVCAGGYGDTETTKLVYSYDPGSDAWTARADMPTDVWAGAVTVANGKLVVAGGVANNSSGVTNATYAYDLSANTWSNLPNANKSYYRTSMACGIFKIGGRGPGSGAPGEKSSEKLAGFDDCGAAGGDATWLKETPQTVTIAPGQTVTVKVITSAKAADGVTQPGTYKATLGVKTGTPYGNYTVNVQMLVAPTATMGKLVGTIGGHACDGTYVTLANAQVQVKNISTGVRTDLKTDAKGNYAWWFKSGKYQVIVSKDGWAADVAVFTLVAQEENDLSLTLDKLGCTAPLKVPGGTVLPA